MESYPTIESKLSVHTIVAFCLLLLPLGACSPIAYLPNVDLRFLADLKYVRPSDINPELVNPYRSSSVLQLAEETATVSNRDHISNVITQLSKAILHSKTLMFSYFKDTFGYELSRDREKYAGVHYDFLVPIIGKFSQSLDSGQPKNGDEVFLPQDHISLAYVAIQMFAVALEEIVSEQMLYGGKFQADFVSTENDAKHLLFEIQVVLLAEGIHCEAITRDILSSEYRDLDCDTNRNIRDFIILRDYVNTLETMQQTFQHHFLTAVDPSGSSEDIV